MKNEVSNEAEASILRHSDGVIEKKRPGLQATHFVVEPLHAKAPLEQRLS
jgi:hypothetical protein